MALGGGVRVAVSIGVDEGVGVLVGGRGVGDNATVVGVSEAGDGATAVAG
jgi:hypothetical protein